MRPQVRFLDKMRDKLGLLTYLHLFMVLGCCSTSVVCEGLPLMGGILLYREPNGVHQLYFIPLPMCIP